MSNPSTRLRSEVSASAAVAAGSSSPATGVRPASADRSVRVVGAGAQAAVSGSSRTSLVSPSTWVFGATSTSATRPETGARSTVSSFMLSTTATMSPACTASPAATGMATTMAGAGARTRPASPPAIRCTAPSTSTR